jgi:hypothetical protein
MEGKMAEGSIAPFAVMDCTLAAIATGQRAQNMRELRDKLAVVHPECVYYHFWGGLLHPRFDDPEYSNDFASWVRHALHDHVLAERLGVIDPADFTDMEALRQEVIERIEERLDEIDPIAWAPGDQQFHFVRCQTVVFDTGKRLHDPWELAAQLPQLSLGSIFYHVIDARRRDPLRIDDFRAWLLAGGDTYSDLCHAIAAVDPYFTSLADLRARLAEAFAAHLKVGIGT